jgi:hypothetical protein
MGAIDVKPSELGRAASEEYDEAAISYRRVPLI